MEEIRPTDGVRVELGGKEYTLRYTFAALKAAKKEFNGSILKQETLQKLDEENLGKIIWYGLRAHHPDVTLEYVEENVDYPTFPYFMSKFVESVTASMPEPKNEQSPEQNQTKVIQMEKSTGANSGQSPDSTSDLAMASSGA
jgi:hypothetical protein